MSCIRFVKRVTCFFFFLIKRVRSSFQQCFVVLTILHLWASRVFQWMEKCELREKTVLALDSLAVYIAPSPCSVTFFAWLT